MQLIKLIVGFYILNEPDFLLRVLAIAAALKNNPYFQPPWPAPVPDHAGFLAEIDAYQVLFNNAAGGDKPSIALRNTGRVKLTSTLKKVGAFCEIGADGDASKLATTGFEMHHPIVKATLHEPLGPLTGLTLKRGILSGTAVAHAASEPSADVFNAQITSADPTVEANWSDIGVGSFPHCNRIELTGLIPGKTYYVRMRGFNKNGYGVWTVSAGLLMSY